MKRVLIATVAIFLFTGFVFSTAVHEESAYTPNQTETAYAFTHGGYVGRAIATVNSNGVLTVSIDEAFLPHTLALVDTETAEWDENNTITYESHGPKNAAKYVEYDGKVYVGVSVGTGLSFVEAGESGEPEGSKDLEKNILRNQSSMANYYSVIESGGFKLLTGFGETAVAVTTTSYGGLSKKTSPGYWAFGIGWAGNIGAIEDFIAEYGLQYSLSKMSKAAEENADGIKPWSVADVVTGATNSDFKDYIGMAQAAAGRLKTE